jgi:hypothetical protein
MLDPTIAHLKEARKILKYLHKTRKLGLRFRRDFTTHVAPDIIITPDLLVGFTDATWADDPVTRRSQTGYAYLLNGAAISWRSKQQHEVANSSSEAKFRAYNLCGREGLFLRKLLAEFSDRTPDCGSNVMPPTTIYSDNETCIKWLRNKCHHEKTKHIGCATLSICEQVMDFKTLDVKAVRTEHQTADVMSKPLNIEKHWKHTKILLGLPDHAASSKNRRAGKMCPGSPLPTPEKD